MPIAGAFLLCVCVAVIITVLVNGGQKVVEFIRERAQERKYKNNGRIL